MDPLTLLREFCISRKLGDVNARGERIHFGERFTFPKGTPTSYKSQLGKGDFYSLEAVVHFIKSFHGGPPAPSFPDYIKSARARDIPYIAFIDRKDLESYLTGATNASNNIQASLPDLVLTAPGEEAGAERASKLARTGEGDIFTAAPGVAVTEDDTLALREILAHERVLRDRNSQLLVQNKNFRRALDLLRITNDADKAAAAKAAAAAAKAARAAPPPPKRAPPPPPPKPAQKAIPILPSGRFDRQTGQDLAAMGMDEYANANIQAYGVAAAPSSHQSAAPEKAAASADSRRPGPPPPPPSGAPPPPPHGAPPAPAPAHRSSQSHAPHHSGSHRQHHSSAAAPSKADPRKGGIPIIIVPAAATARINMFNAKTFLESGTYKTPEECRADGVQKQSLMLFNRSIGRSKGVMYQIMDKAPDVKSRDWHRVVAVIVSGAAWQFRGWPFKGADGGDMVDTFSRVLGIHVSFQDETLPETIKTWAVHKFRLQRGTRHRDMALVKDIFAALDAFLLKKKSQLAY